MKVTDSNVRIESVQIENFKNIVRGSLSFENTRKPYRASILGLYGQNGSGKTALIDAVSLLHHALCGRPVPRQYAEFIHVDSEYAVFRFRFRMTDETTDTRYRIEYAFRIRREEDEELQNTHRPGEDTKEKVALYGEVLSYSREHGEEKRRFSPLIDTRTDAPFLPRTRYEALAGKEKSDLMELLIAKKITTIGSRSFIFSREFLDVVRKNCQVPEYLTLLEGLVNFGNFELFVINTANSGLISLNALPISFKYDEKNRRALGNLTVALNRPTTIPEEAVPIVNMLVHDMNIVLTQIVPGLGIRVRELGAQLMDNNQTGSRIQLISVRNGEEIPLRCESDGIKKIISILQLLIVVYNKSSITVAIDELDSGIFEYLLGEILRIISEKGKGQLLFTSHNLRPLETIDRGFIAFTTTNPENRYIRFNHVKSNHNLRDFYFRDIVLGEQNEVVYEATSNYEIAMAFREAGENCGA
ncbi:ATP-binding protein [bacterium 1XD42-94]|nr:ATP-binding protein [bacterium 1XD42-76]NBK05494.1 ATP-binding protein [bacterium 1XD42-94]